MKTYCAVRPRKSSMSARTCSGVKATQSTTASNSRPPRASRADAGSRMSPRSTVASGGSGRSRVLPRFSTVRSMPRAAASREHAELITPLPPMNRTRRSATDGLRQQFHLGRIRGARIEDELVAAALLERGNVASHHVRAYRRALGDLPGHVAEESVVPQQVAVGGLAGIRAEGEVGQRQLARPARFASFLPGLVDRSGALGEHLRRAATHDPPVSETHGPAGRGRTVTADDQLRAARAGRWRADGLGAADCALACPDPLHRRELLVQPAATAR